MSITQAGNLPVISHNFLKTLNTVSVGYPLLWLDTEIVKEISLIRNTGSV